MSHDNYVNTWQLHAVIWQLHNVTWQIHNVTWQLNTDIWQLHNVTWQLNTDMTNTQRYMTTTYWHITNTQCHMATTYCHMTTTYCQWWCKVAVHAATCWIRLTSATSLTLDSLTMKTASVAHRSHQHWLHVSAMQSIHGHVCCLQRGTQLPRYSWHHVAGTQALATTTNIITQLQFFTEYYTCHEAQPLGRRLCRESGREEDQKEHSWTTSQIGWKWI